jgi:hypothetical protein
MNPIGYNYEIAKSINQIEISPINKKTWKGYLNFLIKSKIFYINNKQIKLFDNTKNKIFNREMPFKNIYLNFEKPIYLDNYRIYGINVNKTLDKNIVILIMGFNVTNTSIKRDVLCPIIINNNGLDFEKVGFLEVFKEFKIYKIFCNRIGNIVCNFLDFINHFEVDIKEVNISKERNKKRLKKGKEPLNDFNFIEIKGELKKYVNSLNSNNKNNISYMFDVRGHYRHFRDIKRYKILYEKSEIELNKQGYQINTKGLISKYIKSYKKGQGIYIKKNYNIYSK